MNWADVINETLRYLEKNILTVRSPKEVAMEVHVSSGYLQNSFQMITGYTIGEYIRSRRLYLAAMDRIEKDEKIIDVAERYGYETPESFTKAFSRFHDATPNEIKKKNKPAKVFLPLKLKFSVKGADTVDVVIEKMPKFKILGLADVFVFVVQSFETAQDIRQELLPDALEQRPGKPHGVRRHFFAEHLFQQLQFCLPLHGRTVQNLHYPRFGTACGTYKPQIFAKLRKIPGLDAGKKQRLGVSCSDERFVHDLRSRSLR